MLYTIFRPVHMQNNLLMPGIIHFADRLIVNKIDLVPGEDDLSRIESRLRQINRFAPIIRTSNSSVSAWPYPGSRENSMRHGPACGKPG